MKVVIRPHYFVEPETCYDRAPDFVVKTSFYGHSLVNTSYLREFTKETLSPCLSWRALRYGWSVLDDLRKANPQICQGSVEIKTGEGGTHVFTTMTGKDVIAPICLLTWNGGDFLATCSLTHRQRIDPYTIEFKESMMVEEERRVIKRFTYNTRDYYYFPSEI
jgi:hypothetical protein